MNRALRIDPVSPPTNAHMLSLLVNMHQHERAVRQFHKLVELEPNYRGAYYLVGVAHWDAGSWNDAAAAFIRMEALGGASSDEIEALSAAAAHDGARGYARERIRQLQHHATRSYVSPLDLAGPWPSRGGELKSATLDYSHIIPLACSLPRPQERPASFDKLRE